MYGHYLFARRTLPNYVAVNVIERGKKLIVFFLIYSVLSEIRFYYPIKFVRKR